MAEGECLLRDLDRELLGDLSGRSMLHLLCHFGLDTLSLANIGARVVGVDFSGAAIALARELEQNSRATARFVDSDVVSLPASLRDRSWDVVYMSHGVLEWIADLDAWADAIAACLRPGGHLVVIDVHPFWHAVDRTTVGPDGKLSVELGTYSGTVVTEPLKGSYLDRSVSTAHLQTHRWRRGVAELINAVVGTGLRICEVREDERACYPKFHQMDAAGTGWWRLPGLDVPKTLALVAEQP